MTRAHNGPLVLALASLKGGVGKTTSAVHIAAHLAESWHTVLLADGDRIRTAMAWGRGGALPFTVGGMASLSGAGKYDAVVIDSRGGLEDADLIDLADARAALEDAGIPALAQTVRLPEAFRDANNGGVLVRDVRGNSLAKGLWAEYGRVTREIVAMTGGKL